MYAAHKKDINRHKSFHPLTHRNLSRVEGRLRDKELQMAATTERNAQLQRDTEQRRYDDLLLAAGGADTPGVQQAMFRRVENIFAAEDDAGLLKSQSGQLMFKKEKTQWTQDPSSNRNNCSNINSKGVGDGDASGGRKRGRESDDNGADEQQKKIITGFISSGDAAQLRKELSALQKKRHDPLLRIERFQNSVVAAEAKRRALETIGNSVSLSASPNTEKDAIRSRIQDLLQMKKKK